MEEDFDRSWARGDVGSWLREDDEPAWFVIKDNRTLNHFVSIFGKSATEDELYDWDRSDLIELIFRLGGVD